MSTPVYKHITHTDENVILLSPLINVVSDRPDVSDFIQDTPGNVFFKRLGTRSNASFFFTLLQETMKIGLKETMDLSVDLTTDIKLFLNLECSVESGMCSTSLRNGVKIRSLFPYLKRRVSLHKDKSSTINQGQNQNSKRGTGYEYNLLKTIWD